MEKRVVLALVLSFLVLLLWSLRFSEERKQKSPPLPSATEPAPAETFQPEEEEIQRGLSKVAGKDIIVETDLYKIVLTTAGARMKSCFLKRYEEVKVEKKVLEGDLLRIETELKKTEQKIEEARRRDEQGSVHPKQMENLGEMDGARGRLIRERDRLKYLIEKEFLPGERVELVPFDGNFYGNYPLTLISPAMDGNGQWNFAPYQSSQDELTLNEEKESGTIEMCYVSAEGIEVKKRFQFTRDSYLIGLEIAIQNNSSLAISEENLLVAYGPGIGLTEKTQVRGRQIYPFASWVEGKLKRHIAGRKDREGLLRETMRWGAPKLLQGQIGWTAMRNSYFAAALIPEGEVAGAELLENEDGTRKISLKMQAFSVPSGGEVCKKLSLYLGPQDTEVLQRSSPGLEHMVDFGRLWWIARPIHGLLRIFHGWFGNYGLSIVLLSLTIKLVFYPFTHKSFEAMKKMQEDMKGLQPEIEVLREKHKNNPQKLNKATMELYKKRGINPMGGCKGCLPMLFQMPVFFALYAVLYNAIELRHAPFFGWINDLSSRDPYYVLPILMGVTMFLQQKLTGMGGTSSAQPDQAKMMNVIMPIFLTFIFFNLASGIVLYWLCFNVFTILEQLLVRRRTAH